MYTDRQTGESLDTQLIFTTSSTSTFQGEICILRNGVLVIIGYLLYRGLTLMLVVANSANTNDANSWKIIETLANGCSSERAIQ